MQNASRWRLPVWCMTGCTSGDRPPAGPFAASDGGALYKQACAACHGADLRGTKQGPPLLDVLYSPAHRGRGVPAGCASRGWSSPLEFRRHACDSGTDGRTGHGHRGGRANTAICQWNRMAGRMRGSDLPSVVRVSRSTVLRVHHASWSRNGVHPFSHEHSVMPMFVSWS